MKGGKYIGKRILLVLLAMVFLVTACGGKEGSTIKKQEKEVGEIGQVGDNESGKPLFSEDKVKEIIRKDRKELMKSEKGRKNFIPAVSIDVLEIREEKEDIVAFVNIIEMVYSFEAGIFKEEGGGILPARYTLSEEGQVKERLYPEDGAYFASSILKMTGGDRKLSDKMVEGQSSFLEKYDILMQDLKKEAQKRELKEFTHKVEEIPGFERDVEYVEGRNNPSGVISIIKKEDYKVLQEKRKNIVPPDQAGSHWVYAPCVEYHEKTGICVEGILDYSD